MNTPNDRYVPPVFNKLESSIVSAPAEIEKSHEWGNFVRSIEHSVENFRAQADESTLEKYENRKNAIKGRIRRLAHRALGMPRSKAQLISALTNAEAIAEGKKLPRGANVTSQMFWYGDKDWFYQVTELTEANGPTAMTARYQVQYDQLIKSVDGKAVYLGPGEQEAFTTWIQQYHSLLANEIYLGLNDTMADEQLDYLMDDVNEAMSHRKPHGPRDDYRLAA